MIAIGFAYFTTIVCNLYTRSNKAGYSILDFHLSSMFVVFVVMAIYTILSWGLYQFILSIAEMVSDFEEEDRQKRPLRYWLAEIIVVTGLLCVALGALYIYAHWLVPLCFSDSQFLKY